MRFKATIVLTFVLILLGAYLIYFEIPGAEKKRASEIAAKKLFAFSQSEITAITIQKPDGFIELEHFPDHPLNPWRLNRPVSMVANERNAGALASQLEQLQSTRLVEVKPAELKEFGLAPPAYTVIITLNQADTEILEIGTENLTGTDVYVRKGEGTSLYLVPAGIKKAVDKDLNEWRRRELFPFVAGDVKRIRLASKQGIVEIDREGEGWSIKKPLAAPGDPSEISNVLGSLVNLRGEDFIDDLKEEKVKELGAPILEVRLLVDQVEREASFYQAPGDPEAVYAVTTADAPIYKISHQSFQLVDQPPAAFRDRKVVSLIDPQQVESIEISRSGRNLILVKKEEGWFLKDSKETKVDLAKIARFLSDLHGLRVEAFLDGRGPAKIATPRAAVRLKGKEGKLIDEVIFGEAEGDRLHARSSHQPGPFLLKKEALDRIPEEKNLTSSDDPREPAAHSEEPAPSPPEITPAP